ncbi:MAG TPA: nitric oxide reductase transcriptional regulator NorR [Polyangiaceae bacterium]
MLDPDAFIRLTLDLTASLGSVDRYRRLLDTVKTVLPCDAAALLKLDPKGALVAVATHGLRDDVMGRSFALVEHPRLEALCRSDEPICFPEDSSLPDPFDGLLAADARALSHVHACLGCALRVEGELVGVLTADALDPKAFHALDFDAVRALGALAGAALRTAELIEALELRALKESVPPKAIVNRVRKSNEPLVGRSEAYLQLKREIDLVGPSDLAVLVMGETGVGKELVVHAIHDGSPRRSAPFVQVNCAALPESLVESELFGHVRGAFTGAQSDRQGKLQQANGGTLFLDEVGELPLSVQPKLLRAIQQGEIQRVGSDAISRVDVRILAATNRELSEEVRAGRFRPDLYHRLAVYPLRVPPLRDRRQDIAPLVGHFVDQTRSQLGAGKVRVTEAFLERLQQHDFPGNVRELENLVSRAVLRATARGGKGSPTIVEVTDLGNDLSSHTTGAGAPTTNQPPAAAVARQGPEQREATPAFVGSMRESVDRFQRELIQRVVSECDGNWSRAAERLQLNRANLHHLAVRLGLK